MTEEEKGLGDDEKAELRRKNGIVVAIIGVQSERERMRRQGRQ